MSLLILALVQVNLENFSKEALEQIINKKYNIELIKKGIELINEVGKEKLSLRKLAIICGVSNSAPYTHFKSKDELLKEMSFYIFNLLKLELENTRKKYKNKENLLVMLGKTYVIFFLKNPKYYYFLSSRKDIEIDLSLKIDNNNITINKYQMY